MNDCRVHDRYCEIIKSSSPTTSWRWFALVPRSEVELGQEPSCCGLSGRIGVEQEADMNGLIYLVGLIVVILAILSFFGLR